MIILTDLTELRRMAHARQKENKEFFRRLKRKKYPELDQVVHSLHEKAFSLIDCLKCANCCKTISPVIKETDIRRMAQKLRMKPSELSTEFLETDQDLDYVFRVQPCPFLMTDHFCSVYESRPIACREYPHTDRRRFRQILDISLKNVAICPAVYAIVEEMKQDQRLQ